MKCLILAKFRTDAIWRPGEREPARFDEDIDSSYGGFEGMFGEPGFLDFVYGRVDGGWVGIANVDSPKALWNRLTSDRTLYSLFEWHIEPLIGDNVIPSYQEGQVDDLPTIFPKFMQSSEWDH